MQTVLTNHNATVATNGKLGPCYYFDGSTYLNETTIDWSTFDASAFSVAFWLKMDSHSSNRQIVHIGSALGWTNIRIGVLATNNGNISFHISNGSSQIAYSFGIPYELGGWHHFVATYHNHTMKWYYDGEYKKSYTTSFDPAFNSSSHFSIGAASNGDEKLVGYVNDVRFYDNELSALEVKHLSQGLAAWYPLSVPEKELIPDEYQEVEYLESNGNQFINSGIIINTWPFSLRAKMAWASFLSGERDFWGNFSGLTTTNTSWSSSSYCWVVGKQSSTNWYQWGGSAWAPASGETLNTIYQTEFIYKGSTGRQAIINGNVYNSTASNGNSIVPTDAPIGLFSGAGTRLYCAAAVRIYDAQIIHQGKVLRDFVPCYRKSDNKPGMYDRISGQFFINSATGADFTMGEDKIELPKYTCVYDCSGYGRNCNNVYGNLVPVKIKSPRYTTCTYFNGSSYCNTDPGAFAWCLFDNITISVWVKTKTKRSGYSGAFGLCHKGSANQKSWQYTDYGGIARINANNTSYTNLIIDNDTEIADWHHYCMVLENSTTWRSYIDGVAKASGTHDWKTSTVHPGTLIELGCDWPGSNETFLGWAVDFRCYMTALNAADIKELYETSMEIDANGNILPRQLTT